jgi:hypothetical protein
VNLGGRLDAAVIGYGCLALDGLTGEHAGYRQRDVVNGQVGCPIGREPDGIHGYT